MSAERKMNTPGETLAQFPVEQRGGHVAAWVKFYLVGTPYLHQGRKPGEAGGIDCFGVLILPAIHFGLAHHDYLDYDRDVDGSEIEERLAIYCDRVEDGTSLVGDIVLFWIDDPQNPCHFGMIAPHARFLHARERMTPEGSVCEEHPLTRYWHDRIYSIWRYRF
jgi:cell wall-associated NlpC family hydrolase